jgi:hypothetical protein
MDMRVIITDRTFSHEGKTYYGYYTVDEKGDLIVVSRKGGVTSGLFHELMHWFCVRKLGIRIEKTGLLEAIAQAVYGVLAFLYGLGVAWLISLIIEGT